MRIRIVCDHVASNQFEFAGLILFFCSNWTKLAYTTRIYHVIKNFEEKVDQICDDIHKLSRDGGGDGRGYMMEDI